MGTFAPTDHIVAVIADYGYRVFAQYWTNLISTPCCYVEETNGTKQMNCMKQ